MFKKIFLLLTALSAINAVSAQENLNISICPFKNDKKAAVSFTFDDGPRGNLTEAAPLLEKYGMKATFYIVAGRPKDKADANPKGTLSWDEIKLLQDQGHEIGNHSMTHAQLKNITDSTALDKEINGPIAILKEKIGKEPETFCFPGNGFNDEVMKLTLVNHINTTSNIRLFYGDTNFTPEKSKEYIDKAIANGKWIVPMLHGITEKGGGWKPFSDISVFEEILKYAKSQENEIWIDTFANVSKYTILRDKASIEAISKTSKNLEFTIKSPEQYKRCRTELTVAVKNGNKSFSASQDGKALAVNGNKINVMPDSPVKIEFKD